MKKILLGLPLSIALSMPLVNSAHAGLGDLVKQLEDAGKEVLDSTSKGDSSIPAATTLDTDTLIKGLKQALKVGSRRAIKTIGEEGGYLNDANIRVPLPDTLQQASGLLRKMGMGAQVDEFEASMNRAAEKAAPHATQLIIDAVNGMTIEDARRIYEGPDNAATTYFEEKTRARLSELFMPSVRESMNEVGVTRYYNVVADEARQLPYVGQNLDVNLENHVTEKALDGLFYTLAEEEKRIRENPAARTTELLKKVFQ